jgi:hypothetical protein
MTPAITRPIRHFLAEQQTTAVIQITPKTATTVHPRRQPSSLSNLPNTYKGETSRQPYRHPSLHIPFSETATIATIPTAMTINNTENHPRPPN